MLRSKKYSINFRDVVHGFVTAFLSASLMGVVDVCSTGDFPTLIQLKSELIIGFSAGVGYLLKKFITNSDGVIVKKEPKQTLQ